MYCDTLVKMKRYLIEFSVAYVDFGLLQYQSLNEAKKTIHGITGVEVGDMTAKVDPNSGNITEYHTAVKIAFGVEH